MKASKISICIFTWARTDTGTVDGGNIDTWPEKEAAIGRTLGNALAQLQFDGNNLPIDYDNSGLCSLSDANVGVQNQNAVVGSGINPQTLPALQVFAQYPDGRTAYYTLPNPTTEDVQARIIALYNGRFATQKGLLCTFVPQLCSLPGWLWLIAAGYTTFESVTSKDTRRVVYGGAAAVLWYEFFQRGGFQFLQNKK